MVFYRLTYILNSFIGGGGDVVLASFFTDVKIELKINNSRHSC